MCEATRYISEAGIPGSIVEVGVWRGGSAMAAALTLKKRRLTNRDFYLFDTFDGSWDPPSRRDRLVYPQSQPRPRPQKNVFKHGGFTEKQVSTRAVRARMSDVGYPLTRVHCVKGQVQKTVPRVLPEEIAILRLDTDFYSSTYHSLKNLYPRLAVGGVLIIDDYGKYEGATQATDRYIRENRLKILLNRIDSQGRIGIKTV